METSGHIYVPAVSSGNKTLSDWVGSRGGLDILEENKKLLAPSEFQIQDFQPVD